MLGLLRSLGFEHHHHLLQTLVPVVFVRDMFLYPLRILLMRNVSSFGVRGENHEISVVEEAVPARLVRLSHAHLIRLGNLG